MRGRLRILRAAEAALVFVLPMVLYLGIPGLWEGVLDHPFISLDDDHYILNNPFIRGMNWENFKAWWTAPYFGNYAPLHLFSYALNYALRGDLVPADFHLTDALLHAGAALGALFLLRRLAGPGLPALLGARVFALHPVQVEAVAWASERKSTLALIFLFPAFVLYLRHRDRTPDGTRASWPTPAYAGALLCYLMSLLAKGTGVVLPVLLVLHERLFDPRPRRAGRTLETVPFFLLALALGLATIWAQGTAGAIHARAAGEGDHFLTMLVAFKDYLRTLFFPVNLNLLYYPEMVPTPLRLDFIASAAVLAAALAATGLGLRRAPKLAFWSLWFFVSLAPVSQVLSLTVLRADRYLHLAALALGGVLAAGLRAASGSGARRGRAAAVGMVAVLACRGALSVDRIAVWKSAESLWRDSLEKAPRSHIAHASLAEGYFEDGDYERALAGYREAVRLQPRYAIGHMNIGFVEVRRGRMPEAAAAFRRAMAAAPEPPAWNPAHRESYAYAHFYIGVRDLEEGKAAEGEARFRRALHYRPDFPEAAFSLGLALSRQARQDEAYAAFRRAVKLRPDFYEAHREAALAGLRGGAPVAEALHDLRAALALRPAGGDAEARRRLLEEREAKTRGAGREDSSPPDAP